MTATLIIQGLLVLATLWALARSFRRYYEGARYDTRLGEAIVAAIRAGAESRARRLGETTGFAARLGMAFFEAKEEGSDVGIRLDQEYVDIRFELSQGRRLLRVLASFGSASALLGACWQFLWLMSGKHGLATLVPGMPLRLATERGALAATLGFSVTVVCIAGSRLLAKEGGIMLEHLKKVADGLERADESEPGAPHVADST